MTEKLLPCPFCGGSDLRLFGESAPEWWVSCQTCRASSQTSSSNDRAASAWNRRIAQPNLSVEPVAVVGSVYQLRWLGGGDFPALIMRHELKPGSKLYAAPVAAQPDPAMAGDDRIGFEAWLRGHWSGGYSCPKKPNGEYAHSEAQSLWLAWQSARKRVQPASGKGVK